MHVVCEQGAGGPDAWDQGAGPAQGVQQAGQQEDRGGRGRRLVLRLPRPDHHSAGPQWGR